MATFVLIPLTLSAADNGDASSTTSILAPEATPSHSLVRLSVLVLAITGVIFVVVFSLIIYAIVRFRLRWLPAKAIRRWPFSFSSQKAWSSRTSSACLKN